MLSGPAGATGAEGGVRLSRAVETDSGESMTGGPQRGDDTEEGKGSLCEERQAPD